MMKFLKQAFPTRVTKNQAKDTGMAMVLLCLLLGFLTDTEWMFKLAVPLLVLTMIAPRVFHAIAVVWLGLSHLLGTVVSRILLTVVFFVVVFPVGLIRRMLGKDSLQLRQFGKGKGSVMRVRDHVYAPADVDKPY
jgi:Saxitoxin biosynthesis operon protein SxtJ